MNDLDFVRNYPEEFDSLMLKRGLQKCSKKILELDAEHRKFLTELQTMQKEANSLSKKIGLLKSKKDDTSLLELEAKKLFEKIEDLEKNFDFTALRSFMEMLPNIIDENVPIGKSEDENVEVFKFGNIRKFDFIPKSHQELGEKLEIIDFENTVQFSGSRFSSIKGKLAKLFRVLVNFMLDHHITHYGYEEIIPPCLVRDHAMYNVGQLPKFADESFATTNGMRLIPTAEVPLTNFVCNKIISQNSLPLRFAAYTECFRMEAGSSGKDISGILRQHQFGKVELVSIVEESESDAELERMVGVAESILQKLEIPYRRVILCSADLGFSAAKTYDIEVWLPSQNKYREISSCSNCKTFQARRMGTKYITDAKTKKFVHTLNGSALAIGRTIIAIMENYQNSNMTISIPKVLQDLCGFDLID